jgi:hypothetical protein
MFALEKEEVRERGFSGSQPDRIPIRDDLGEGKTWLVHGDPVGEDAMSHVRGRSFG